MAMRELAKFEVDLSDGLATPREQPFQMNEAMKYHCLGSSVGRAVDS